MTEQPRPPTLTSATADEAARVGVERTRPLLEALDLGALATPGFADATLVCDIDDPDCEVPVMGTGSLGEPPAPQNQVTQDQS